MISKVFSKAVSFLNTSLEKNTHLHFLITANLDKLILTKVADLILLIFHNSHVFGIHKSLKPKQLKFIIAVINLIHKEASQPTLLWSIAAYNVDLKENHNFTADQHLDQNISGLEKDI